MTYHRRSPSVHYYGPPLCCDSYVSCVSSHFPISRLASETGGLDSTILGAPKLSVACPYLTDRRPPPCSQCPDPSPSPSELGNLRTCCTDPRLGRSGRGGGTVTRGSNRCIIGGLLHLADASRSTLHVAPRISPSCRKAPAPLPLAPRPRISPPEQAHNRNMESSLTPPPLIGRASAAAARRPPPSRPASGASRAPPGRWRPGRLGYQPWH